jgi:hypothetical protein
MKFESNSFVLDLPEEARELSSYAFVLPIEDRFKPSVMIKYCDLDPETRFTDYVAKQYGQMRKKLDHFTTISKPEPQRTPDTLRCVFEWGAGERRFRQTQVYMKKGQRLYTLTGTDMAAKAKRSEELIDKVMASFKPKQ